MTVLHKLSTYHVSINCVVSVRLDEHLDQRCLDDLQPGAMKPVNNNRGDKEKTAHDSRWSSEEKPPV